MGHFFAFFHLKNKQVGLMSASVNCEFMSLFIYFINDSYIYFFLQFRAFYLK